MGAILDQFGRPFPTAKAARRPEMGSIYSPSQRDLYSSYPSHGLTPSRLTAILKEADQGYAWRQAELFRQMEEKDAHVGAEMAKRKAAVLGLPYEIQPDSEEPLAEKAAELCREVVYGLEDFDELLEQLLDALSQGWAMIELIWGIEGGRAVVTDFRWVPQERTRWDDNRVPRLATDQEYSQGIEIPPYKVLYHRNQGRAVHEARAGLGRSVVWWWLFKNYSVKDWVAFAEVFGVPLRLGRYDTGTSQDDRDALKRALVTLGTDGAALISKATDIELVEVKGGAGGHSKMVFSGLAEYCDKAISKAVVGQTLSAESGGQGSYALGKVQADVRQDLRDRDAGQLAKTIRQQLFRPLVLFNLGPDAPVPWFNFTIQEPEDLKAKSEVYEAAQRMGLPIGLSHFYEAFGIPQPEEGEELLPPPAPLPAGQDEPGRAANRASARGLARMSMRTRRDRQERGRDAMTALMDAAVDRAAPAADAMTQPYQELVAVAWDWDDLLAGLAPAVRRATADGLADVLYRALLAAEINGRLSVGASGRALAKRRQPANVRRLGGSRRAVMAQGEQLLMEPVDPEEAFQFWAGQAPVTREVFDRLAADAKLRAFTVAGVYREDVLAGLYQGIDRALREGTILAQFQADAQELFSRAGLAGLKPWHLETVFRTNLQSAYSAGRYKQMMELAGSRPYWQYSAVMDAATRPSHAAMDGKVYHLGHRVWDTWYPPNGFGCRCDVISLSAEELADEGLAEAKSAPGVEPDAGWASNVGTAGWGRGMVEAALGGGMMPKGGWKFAEDLVSEAGPLPEPARIAAMPAVPPKAEELVRELGSERAVREYYRQLAADALGMEPDGKGGLKDLPILGSLDEGVVLNQRALDYITTKEKDLNRGRFAGLMRDLVEDPDEIWLVPGRYGAPGGKVSIRRRYLKYYQRPDKTKPGSVLFVATAERGVWTSFNHFATGPDWNRLRVGVRIK